MVEQLNRVQRDWLLSSQVLLPEERTIIESSGKLPSKVSRQLHARLSEKNAREGFDKSYQLNELGMQIDDILARLEQMFLAEK
ncbi:hypothetical protein [Hyphococcus sp.]|jgi:hypothetical protein|uniref:hypothetical protein n=1 Tax=Hyphococcus sp. TaxID=2038636 RepID=UPI003D097EC9